MSENENKPIIEKKETLSPEELIAKKQRKEERRKQREIIENKKKNKSSKKKTKIIIGSVTSIVLLFFLGVIFYSPYYQVNQLAKILEEEQYDKMGNFVDQEKIGSYYSIEFERKMKIELQEHIPNGQFTWLGEEMAPTILEREIGKYSTPKAVKNTILNGFRTAYNDELDANINGWMALKNSEKKYSKINSFEVQLNEKDKPLHLTFERYGLFSWKIVKID